MDPLILSVAFNIAGIAGTATAAVLALKLADARQERDEASDRCVDLGLANIGLRCEIAELRPDAERGKRARLQAHAALAKAQAVNREKRDERNGVKG